MLFERFCRDVWSEKVIHRVSKKIYMNKFFAMCMAVALAGGGTAIARQSRSVEPEGSPIAKLTSVSRDNMPVAVTYTAEGNGFKMGGAPLKFTLAELMNSAKVTANGGNIYGWSKGGWPVAGSLYEFTYDSIELLWTNNTVNPPMGNTYLYDGKLCGPALETNNMSILGGYWSEYDFKTGELISHEEWDLYVDPIYEMVTYNPSDGYVYAMMQWIPKGQGQVFLAKALPTDMKNPTILGTLQAGTTVFTGMCYDGNANRVYALNHLGELVSITSDGDMESIWNVDISSQFDWLKNWMTAMAYSPKDGLIYFTPMSLESTALATLNPATGEANVYATTPSGQQFYSLVTTDNAYTSMLNPEKPEFIEAVFVDGSNKGYNLYKMPSYLVNGDPITSAITLNVSVDETPYSSLTASAGEEVKVEYDLATGMHSFHLNVTVGGETSYTVVTGKYIGYDVPQTPANVQLSAEMIKWDAVATGAKNGYVPAADMVYEVKLNGESLGETKENLFALNLPADTEIDIYVAEIVASYVNPEDGSIMKSGVGVSNNISYGNPYSIPFTVEPTETQAALCQMIDLDGPNDSQFAANFNWHYEDGAFAIETDYNGDGNDDWLILPPFAVEDASKIYTLLFEVANMSADYVDEKIAVYIGSEPTVEGMTTVLKEAFSPAQSNPLYELVNLPLNLSEGTYYIGFHMTSDTSQLGVLLRNISVQYTGLSDNSPAEIEDLVATAGAEGALNATVSFTMPAKNLRGVEFGSDVVLTAEIAGVTTATVTGRPGEKVSAVVETEQGGNMITVYTANGESQSLRQTVSVYTGVEIPATPTNVSVRGFQDLSGAALSWAPVTEGQNGGYVDPAGVSYSVYVMSNYAWDVLETSDTSYTYECPADRPVHQATVGVCSQNLAGSNYQIVAGYVYMGTPYTLPIEETFDESVGGMDLTPWITYLPVEGEAVEFGINYIDRLGDYDVDANIVMYMAGNPGASGMVGVPYFSTEGLDGATVTMTVNSGIDFPGATIYGSTNNLDEMVEIAQIPAVADGEEFNVVKFDIPESLLNQPVVALYISTEIKEENQIFILVDMLIEPSELNAVEAVNNGCNIIAGKGMVTLNGFAGNDVVISTIDGKVVYNGTVKSDCSDYSLASGLYIVNVAGRKVKALVR